MTYITTNRMTLPGPLPLSSQVIFNGNGYDQESQKQLTANGLCRIDSGVDAMCRFTEPKNVKLFNDLKVE
jgi:glutamine synthetase